MSRRTRQHEQGLAHTTRVKTRSGMTRFRTTAMLAASCGAAILGGCEVDSFLDPSIIGRWEFTPTSVPILDRISVIEDNTGTSVETSDVAPEDLIAEAKEYKISPGDRLVITLYDIEQRNVATDFQRDVDLRGTIDLPQLGQLYVANKTVEEVRQTLAEAASRFVTDPLVAVVVAAQRQQTFTVVGVVEQPGPYFIPKPDYRLLEALTAAGRWPESIEEVYVIRQVSLTQGTDGSLPSAPPPPAQGAPKSGAAPVTPGQGTEPTPSQPAATPAAKPGETLIDLIDELAKPKGDQKPADAEAPKQPASLEQPPPKEPAPAQPEPSQPQPGEPKSPASMSMVRGAATTAAPARRRTQPQPATPTPAPSKPSDREPAVPLPAQAGDDTARAPAIELPDDTIQPAARQRQAGASGAGTWVFVNGEWVQIKNGDAGGGGVPPGPNGGPTLGSKTAGAGGKPSDAVEKDATAGALPTPTATQRVIRIPVKQLLAGDARYNIVVRPGDTLHVPSPPQGLVYITGQVQRPGPYNLPEVGKLTLLRAIDSAGGLSAIAIPERVDITRVVGKDRQATIRIDLRAIAEQTQPDIYLKQDDRINVGTNFWALPLAIFRGGLRMNYGFGLVIDRNFGNDVFGPPPEYRQIF